MRLSQRLMFNPRMKVQCEGELSCLNLNLKVEFNPNMGVQFRDDICP